MDGTRRLTGPGGDASGQMSLDFLIGVSMFVLTFLFVLMFISDMLMPFQSNSDELTMTADRIGTECVENLMIISGSRPNVIDMTGKVQHVTDMLNQSTTDHAAYQSYCKDTLGAYSNQPYDVNITLKLNSVTVINGGPVYPTGSLNVGQSKRVVVDKDTMKIYTLYVTVW